MVSSPAFERLYHEYEDSHLAYEMNRAAGHSSREWLPRGCDFPLAATMDISPERDSRQRFGRPSFSRRRQVDEDEDARRDARRLTTARTPTPAATRESRRALVFGDDDDGGGRQREEDDYEVVHARSPVVVVKFDDRESRWDRPRRRQPEEVSGPRLREDETSQTQRRVEQERVKAPPVSFFCALPEDETRTRRPASARLLAVRREAERRESPTRDVYIGPASRMPRDPTTRHIEDRSSQSSSSRTRTSSGRVHRDGDDRKTASSRRRDPRQEQRKKSAAGGLRVPMPRQHPSRDGRPLDGETPDSDAISIVDSFFPPRSRDEGLPSLRATARALQEAERAAAHAPSDLEVLIADHRARDPGRAAAADARVREVIAREEAQREVALRRSRDEAASLRHDASLARQAARLTDENARERADAKQRALLSAARGDDDQFIATLRDAAHTVLATTDDGVSMPPRALEAAAQAVLLAARVAVPSEKEDARGHDVRAAARAVLSATRNGKHDELTTWLQNPSIDPQDALRSAAQAVLSATRAQPRPPPPASDADAQLRSAAQAVLAAIPTPPTPDPDAALRAAARAVLSASSPRPAVADGDDSHRLRSAAQAVLTATRSRPMTNEDTSMDLQQQHESLRAAAEAVLSAPPSPRDHARSCETLRSAAEALVSAPPSPRDHAAEVERMHQSLREATPSPVHSPRDGEDLGGDTLENEDVDDDGARSKEEGRGDLRDESIWAAIETVLSAAGEGAEEEAPRMSLREAAEAMREFADRLSPPRKGLPEKDIKSLREAAEILRRRVATTPPKKGQLSLRAAAKTVRDAAEASSMSRSPSSPRSASSTTSRRYEEETTTTPSLRAVTAAARSVSGRAASSSGRSARSTRQSGGNNTLSPRGSVALSDDLGGRTDAWSPASSSRVAPSAQAAAAKASEDDRSSSEDRDADRLSLRSSRSRIRAKSASPPRGTPLTPPRKKKAEVETSPQAAVPFTHDDILPDDDDDDDADHVTSEGEEDENRAPAARVVGEDQQHEPEEIDDDATMRTLEREVARLERLKKGLKPQEVLRRVAASPLTSEIEESLREITSMVKDLERVAEAPLRSRSPRRRTRSPSPIQKQASALPRTRSPSPRRSWADDTDLLPVTVSSFDNSADRDPLRAKIKTRAFREEIEEMYTPWPTIRPSHKIPVLLPTKSESARSRRDNSPRLLRNNSASTIRSNVARRLVKDDSLSSSSASGAAPRQ